MELLKMVEDLSSSFYKLYNYYNERRYKIMKKQFNTFNKAKANFIAFTKDKEKVIGVISTVTLIGLGALAMYEYNKNTFDQKLETIHDNAYGMGISMGTLGALNDVVNNGELELEEVNKAYDRINETIKTAFEDNQTVLNGYNYMTDKLRKIE